VPPQMASSMRQALYPSGAKDDPRDADLLLDLLLQHRNKLRRLSPDSEATRRVQNLVEEGRKLVDEKTAQINRLTDHLKVYFPQMLEWFGRRCGVRPAGAVASPRRATKGSAGELARFSPQASLSGSRTDRAPNGSNSPRHSGYSRSGGD
jgi:transposase